MGIDIEPRNFSQSCFEVSNFMIRLVRCDKTIQFIEKKTEQKDLTIWHNCLGHGLRLASSSLDKLLDKRRRTKEKVSILLEPSFF